MLESIMGLRRTKAPTVPQTGNQIVRQHLDSLHQLMQLKFEEIRRSFKHKGTRGAKGEEIVREFLRVYLPPSNGVGTGEAFDSMGTTSRQLDVVITNADNPYLNDLSQPSKFMIEGIACAGEVKSMLDAKALAKALEASLAFKSLRAALPRGTTVACPLPDIARFAERRPFFLFAFECTLKYETMVERVVAWNQKHNLAVDQQLDAVFVLGKGHLINYGAGDGGLQFIDEAGFSRAGYVGHASPAGQSLVGFLTWLSSSMPRVTLPAPAILPYLVRDASTIKSERAKARADGSEQQRPA